MSRILAALFVLSLLLPLSACDSTNPQDIDYRRVVITEVNIESWPIRRANGDRWDGFPTQDPDLYFDIVDSGGQLIFTTEDDDAPNVGDNDIGPQWVTDLQFTNFNRTLHFEIWDSDTTDDDFMAETESFNFQEIADRGYVTFGTVSSADQVTVVTFRLRWER